MVMAYSSGNRMPCSSRLCTMRLGVSAESGAIHASISIDDGMREFWVGMGLQCALILGNDFKFIFVNDFKQKFSLSDSN